MDELAGKKLLIIGANPETVPLVETARNLGVITAVTDYNPNAYAKKIADEKYDVDGMDVEGLIGLAQEIEADGVLVGVADRLIEPYQKVCSRLGFYCYGNERQCSVLTDKKAFAEAAGQFGIDTIPRFKIDENDIRGSIEKNAYPLLIKPPDGNSGKGITVCNTPAELVNAISFAKEHSPTGRYLVERYMQCDDILIYYTFINGRCVVSVVADRYTHRNGLIGSPVCIGDFAPSKYTELYMETVHRRMLSLFEYLGLDNCVLLVSSFVEDGRFYFYDPGFRLQGSAPNLIVNEVTGIDHLRMLIAFALTGCNVYCNDESAFCDCAAWNCNTATMWVLLNAGTIGKIEGIQGIKGEPTVFAFVDRFSNGDTVHDYDIGTERQVFARIYLKAGSEEEIRIAIERIQSQLKICDIDGNNMIMDWLRPSIIHR